MYAAVTGASSGLGMEMAKVLAELGFDLILTARRKERLERLAYAIHKKFGVDVVPMPFDLSREEDCLAFHRACLPYDVRVLINNAGSGRAGAFEEIPLEEETAMLKTNVMGMHILLKCFVQTMKSGYILNVASMAAFQECPMMAAYGATKAYVCQLSGAVGYELKRRKRPIHVAALCPGPVDTEFHIAAGVSSPLPGMTAKECARKAIYGLFRGKDRIIPGFSNRLLRFASWLMPRRLILPVEYRIQSRKRR